MTSVSENPSSFKVCFVGNIISYKIFFYTGSIWIAKGSICGKLGDNTNDITDEIYTIYGNATTSTIICIWFKRFRAGNFDLKDKGASAQQR